MKKVLAALLMLAPMSAFAIEAKDLAGTWNVTATSADSTCSEVSPGAIDATVWLVSVTADGEVDVAAQGNTSFPQLVGRISADTHELILESTSMSMSAWFKLAATDAKSMLGLKRVVARGGNKAGFGPCFVDYKLDARKQ
jgi:hypothetical protein